MRNQSRWKPTKVRAKSTGFRTTNDATVLSPASRLIASRQLVSYQSAIQADAKGTLVDIGCGAAPYFEIYRPVVERSICIDWPHSLHTSAFVDISADINAGLPLATECCDTVLMTDVLEHIVEPRLLLGEIYRILRPGGRLIAGVPFMYWVHEAPRDYYRYTEFALRELCTSNGLQVRTIQPYGGAPEIMADLVAKCLASAGLKRVTRLYAFLSQVAFSLPLVARISHRTARTFPLGYMFVAERPRQAPAQ